VLIDIYEMNFECEALFHNSLQKKGDIHDMLLKVSEQSIEEDVHRILIY
jgi:hypothetical protein